MGLGYRVIKKNDELDWVIMLHGIGGSSSIWFRQVRELSKKFNLLLIDLHGHGNSQIKISEVKDYSIKRVAEDIVKLMGELSIESAHIISVSLGTVVARAIEEISPDKVRKQIFTGAVIYINRLLQIIYYICKPLVYILPFMMAYRIAAYILMPFKSHKESRKSFIKEAKKLGKKEFIAWYKMFSEINDTKLADYCAKKMYVMGSQDYMFIGKVKKMVKHNQLIILEKCGHVCNIEKAQEFNEIVLKYLEIEECTDENWT